MKKIEEGQYYRCKKDFKSLTKGSILKVVDTCFFYWELMDESGKIHLTLPTEVRMYFELLPDYGIEVGQVWACTNPDRGFALNENITIVGMDEHLFIGEWVVEGDRIWTLSSDDIRKNFKLVEKPSNKPKEPLKRF